MTDALGSNLDPASIFSSEKQKSLPRRIAVLVKWNSEFWMHSAALDL